MNLSVKTKSLKNLFYLKKSSVSTVERLTPQKNRHITHTLNAKAEFRHRQMTVEGIKHRAVDIRDAQTQGCIGMQLG